MRNAALLLGATPSPAAKFGSTFQTAGCGNRSVLETVPTAKTAVSRQDSREVLRRNLDSENDQGLSSASGLEEERHATHVAALLRDGTSGSGSRHSHDQPPAGPFEFYHDDGLSACQTNTLSTLAQPTGLAADPATAQVGRSQPTQRSSKQRSSTGQRPAQKLSVAQILKNNTGKYVAQYPGQAVPQVQSTLAKLSLCRTAALGGHVYRCRGCPHEVVVHNSCGDRYCPTCSGARRRDWLDTTGELIFDGVDHFQVVFTVPDELSRLALGNRKEIYNLLFASAWSALKQTMQAEHGIDSAALMVLHTWNQKLDAHGHVHAVVPSCGPKLDGSGIGFAQRPGDPTSCGRYLVDANTLRAVYRDEFLKGLDRLHCHGALKLTGEFALLLRKSDWSQWLKKLLQTTWVSYIQPPPRAGQSAEHVLKYLAHYLAGGPISDGRIVSTDEQVGHLHGAARGNNWW